MYMLSKLQIVLNLPMVLLITKVVDIVRIC